MRCEEDGNVPLACTCPLFFFQAEDGIRDHCVTGVQTCALPIWPQGIAARPAPQPVPGNIDWDLWLGPAPERPYNAAYHPFKWRGWWDFGTGALGDMGCHVLDPAFWALDLRDPARVRAESPPVNAETAPAWSILRYEF